MPNRIKMCQKCGAFTMAESHCGMPTKTAHPPKFSATYKYSKYRMMAKNIYSGRGNG